MDGEALKLMLICAAVLAAMGLLIGCITAGQIRNFYSKVREDERRAAEEDEAERARQESGPDH